MSTGLLVDPLFQKHDPGPGHPECAERLIAIESSLAKAGLIEKTKKLKVRAATKGELALAHDPGYVDLAFREIEGGATKLSTGDTSVSADSLDVALAAVGGALNAVDSVFAGEIDNAFCAARPPGHHACHDIGMGFCIFNQVAVAARYAQQKYGIDRVAIVDWDVHHGNGTQDIFYEDGNVFYFSTHQAPWYPHTGFKNETGEGKGKGTILNAPFLADTGMGDIQLAFKNGFLKAMNNFQPDLILISAGFDSRIGDPLGDFRLTDANFSELTKLIMNQAEMTAENRIVSILEGGYSLDGVASAATAHLDTLVSG